MTTHRLARPSVAQTFRQLPRQQRIDLLGRFTFHVLLMGATLTVFTGWIPGLLWVLLATFDARLFLGLYRNLRAEHDAVERGGQYVMDQMTGQLGGAPVVADVGAHCGCVHRYAWNATQAEWLQVEVKNLNPQCPLVEAHDLRGAYP